MKRNPFRKLCRLFRSHGVITLSLCQVKFSVGLVVSLINPVLATHMAALAIPGAVRGVALSSFYIASFATVVGFGNLSDWTRLGRVTVISAALFLLGAAGIGFGFALRWFVFAVLFAAAGVFYGAALSGTYAVLIDVLPNDLCIVGLTMVELAEGVAWNISTPLFNGIKGVWGAKNSYVVFGAFVCLNALVVAVSLFYKLGEFRDRAKNKEIYEKMGLFARVKIIFEDKSFLIAFVSIFISCASYFTTATVFGIFLEDEKLISIFFSAPSSIISLLLFPLVAKYINHEKLATASLLLLAPFYVLICRFGDMSRNAYIAVNFLLIFVRDIVYCVLYALCNLIIIERVGQAHPKIELNGLCSAFFVFSVTLGDTVGTVLAHSFYEKIGFQWLSVAAAVMSLFGFICCSSIFVSNWVKNGKAADFS